MPLNCPHFPLRGRLPEICLLVLGQNQTTENELRSPRFAEGSLISLDDGVRLQADCPFE